MGLFGTACKDLPEENQNPLFALQWDTVVQLPGFIIPGDSLVLKTSLLSQTETNLLLVETKRIPVSGIDFVGPGSDSILPTSIPVIGKNLNQFPVKLKFFSNFFPGRYSSRIKVNDQEKRSSAVETISFSLVNPKFPALVVDTPVNIFTSIPEIGTTSFLLHSRGFGNKIEEMSWQWFDSSGTQFLSEKKVEVVDGMPSEFLLRTQISFPTQGTKRNYFLRLGIRNQDGRGVYYKLAIRRKP